MGKHSAGKRDSIMAPSRFDLQVHLAASQATSMTVYQQNRGGCRWVARVGLPPVSCRPCRRMDGHA